jgi:hypothetical protein
VDVAAVLSVPKTRVVTGPTACTILVATDEAEAYFPANRRVCRQMAAGRRGRTTLVQSLVDTEWRLMRSYPTFSEVLPPRQLWKPLRVFAVSGASRRRHSTCLLTQGSRKHVARAEQSAFNKWNTRVHSLRSLANSKLLEIAKN